MAKYDFMVLVKYDHRNYTYSKVYLELGKILKNL